MGSSQLNVYCIVLYFSLSSEITNFDSGVLCYLHRGNLIYSGPYLPRQNAREYSLQSYNSVWSKMAPKHEISLLRKAG